MTDSRRILFTTPYTDEYYDYYGANCPSTTPHEVYPRTNSYGLRFIRQNIPQVEILEYPTWREFETTLGEDWDVLGVSFFTSDFPKVVEMVRCARESGVSEIWAGNYGALVPEAASLFDRIFLGYSEVKIARHLGRSLPGLIHPPILDYCGDTQHPELSRVGVLFTSRGCSLHCAFCQTPVFAPGALDHVTLDAIGKAIDYYRQQRVGTVLILDETFGLLRQHSRQVVRMLKASGLPWMVMTRTDILAKTLAAWIDAGLAGALLGIENLHQRNVDAVGKRSKAEQALSVVSQLLDAGKNVIAFYMIGFETDDADSIQRDIQFLSSLGIDLVQVSVLTPLHGTPLWKHIAESYGPIESDLAAHDMKTLVWNHPRISRDEMSHLLQWAFETLYPEYQLDYVKAKQAREGTLAVGSIVTPGELNRFDLFRNGGVVEEARRSPCRLLLPPELLAVDRQQSPKQMRGRPRATWRGVDAVNVDPEAPMREEAPSSEHHLGSGTAAFHHRAPGGTQSRRAESSRASGSGELVQGILHGFGTATTGSRRDREKYQRVLASPRSSAGFDLALKELKYPIVARRARGPYFWDVDGTRFLDLCMGFGVELFGHSPSFLIDRLKHELEQGRLLLGPQSEFAGEAAAALCELAGVERVSFCTSGSEAVMLAIRIARAATGRDKIALFSGAYHGHFDQTQVEPQLTPDGHRGARPASPGVPARWAEDALVLRYGTPSALEAIKEVSSELAAVIVEPVQSRRPGLQPVRFLKDLRRLTHEAGIVLIFDEILLGFRVHPGGAAARFGIDADLVTYGKVMGGGMPVAAVAGKTWLLDWVDGGVWEYGDDSRPKDSKVFFAGTYNQHPLAMSATLAVLDHLRNESPGLQERLNDRTTELAGELNQFFSSEGLPIRIDHFGSMFRFMSSRPLDLFYLMLADLGVYVWEGRTCFLSTAHRREELSQLTSAVKEASTRLRDAGSL